MKNFISAGNTIRFTAGANLVSGTSLQVGRFNGVVQDDVANGAEGVLSINGVFNVKKLAGEAISQGDTVYLNSSAEVTKTPAALKVFGIATEGALSAATDIDVMILNQGVLPKADIEAVLTGAISSHSHA